MTRSLIALALVVGVSWSADWDSKSAQAQVPCSSCNAAPVMSLMPVVPMAPISVAPVQMSYFADMPIAAPCSQGCALQAPITYQARKVYVPHQVIETVEREEHVTVRRPVIETAEREETYTVRRPVIETAEREECVTVLRPVMETSQVGCCGMASQSLRYVEERVARKVPVETMRWVDEVQVRKVPTQTLRYVEEQVVRKVPVSEVRTRYEEQIEYVPVTASCAPPPASSCCQSQGVQPTFSNPAPSSSLRPTEPQRQPTPADERPAADEPQREQTPRPALAPGDGPMAGTGAQPGYYYDKLVPVVSPRRLAAQRAGQ
ncbi:MAG TPA: hypothetical protein VHZ24_20390 [Pirellulales bacterium]|nr:hypothetical protein [Pirellulales bacterium]